MTELLNVEEALASILQNIRLLPEEYVNITDALGRTLSKSIRAPIDLPPFANSAMDGFAVRSSDLMHRQTRLTVIMDIPAGYAPTTALKPGQAARIMTGAPVPEGADAVVPVEATDAIWNPEAPLIVGSTVTVKAQAKAGDHIREAGENVQKGQDVLQKGIHIRPQDIGMLIGLGITSIPVYKKPHVAILSTGDELVGPDDPLHPGKIRDTNSYTIEALIQEQGGTAQRFGPAQDTINDVRAHFQDALKDQPDLIISTAGVSVGTFDVVRAVLDELGEIGFWRVNVRPGKPLAFGYIEGIPFFGLPGNPVSAMVTFDIFVRPALAKLTGHAPNVPQILVTVGEDIKSDGRRTYARVRLHQEGEEWIATTTGTQSSGALMSMVLADGLLIIPEGAQTVRAGTQLSVRLLRDLNSAI
jgi:molybdopterin molybdotransferase